MEHKKIHTENSYECDECNWRFTLISELTIHGREFHDTREHACYWCTRYFQTPKLLLQHRNREHNFECSMCNNAFPSEDQLTAHQVVKHGKPEQKLMSGESKRGKPKKEGTRGETKDTKEKRSQESQQPSAVTSA